MRKQSKFKTHSSTLIASQWDCNAQTRLEELATGRDKTYRDVLCPLLFDLLLKTSRGRTVADVGCGLGFFSAYLSERGFDVSGIDISAQSIAIARQHFPSLKFLHCNVLDFPKNDFGQFDACIANMLFHNVIDPKAVANVMLRILNPGGVLVGCLPHPERWFNRKKNSARHIKICGHSAYLTPFKVRGSGEHPAPFTYFNRGCDEYWQDFRSAGFIEVNAISFDDSSCVPDDLVFFVAKKSPSII